MDYRQGGDAAALPGRLCAWLTQVRGLADVTIDEVSAPVGTGASSDTILFDVTWSGPSGPERNRLVVRIAPTTHVVYPEDTFALQFEVLRALADGSPVPVARVHWFEADPNWLGAPFWVMDRVTGQIASDTPSYASTGWLADATPSQQHQAWRSGVRALASVHTTALDTARYTARSRPGR